uniref:Uncharacterized protein LOC105118975 isoform X3 n=1 Tax=Rhizophora mucronata TaxID=61149 RepID=A0A2P2LDN1_RHIMU
MVIRYFFWSFYSQMALLLNIHYRYLAEIGALVLIDDDDTHLSLKEIYGKIAEEKNGCCWEHFNVYRHLKSLGYIVGRHGVPWSTKDIKNSCKSDSFQGTPDAGMVNLNILKGTTSLVEMINNMHIQELRPDFDLYLPNCKFKKSSPGDPNFLLYLIRGSPPSREEIEVLEQQCSNIPLMLCHVEHGRISFFDFKRIELPVLP